MKRVRKSGRTVKTKEVSKKLINLGGTTNDSHFVLERGTKWLFRWKSLKGCVEMEKSKNLEYYLDSRIYSKEEVKQSIEETKKEFPNKKAEVKVVLNEFGMYIITFQFENQTTWFNRIVIKIWRKFKKTLMLGEGEKDRYEQYKQSNKIYKPY